jgi:hypothetical protein
LCKTKKSNLLLSLRAWVCHPNTCTCPRLLGPCFKTGRKKSFGQRHRTCYQSSSKLGTQQCKHSRELSPRLCQDGNTSASLHQSKGRGGYFETPQRIASRPPFSPNIQCTLTHDARNIARDSFKTHCNPCGETASHPHIEQQSYAKELIPFAYTIAISRTFNSLSKVLFIFPSRYLFAIGLEAIFSFRRKLPPILRTNSKVRDSPEPRRTKRTASDRRDSHPL